MGYLQDLFKIFRGTTANDETGTKARDAAAGLNENTDRINNALAEIDEAAEKKSNKATVWSVINDTLFPTIKNVNDQLEKRLPRGLNTTDTAQSLREGIDENKTAIENLEIDSDAVQDIEVDGTVLQKDENGKVVVPVIAGPEGPQGPDGEKGEKGDPFTVDAQGVLADRTAYDSEATGFSFFATDTSLLYFKTDTGWTEGTPFGKGDDGAGGREIELRKNTTHIQWRYVGGTWQDLILLSDLKGDTGEPGADGVNGTDGDDGLSAYQIWLNNGNTGTEQDFLNSLRGADGQDGTDGTNGVDGQDGDSAYEIWLSQGNSGTEQDFLNSLQGQDGQNGQDGSDANVTQTNIENALPYTIQEQLLFDGEFYIDENGYLHNNITGYTHEEVWNTGDSQVFTLPFEATKFNKVQVFPGPPLHRSQYTFLPPNQVRIEDPLTDGDIIEFDFEHFIIQP